MNPSAWVAEFAYAHPQQRNLAPRPQTTCAHPLTTAHRAVLMAIERGQLQNLIFDNQAQANHRAMAAIIGVILKLPPSSKSWPASK